MKVDSLAIIILAAGRSSRFGASKMSYVLSNGKTILENTIEQCQQVFSNITVVVSPALELQKSMSDLGVKKIVVKDENQGMSHSLKAGVMSQGNSQAWMIVLGDMPYVKKETLRQLCENATSQNITVPVFGERRGNPVVIGSDFKSQVLQIGGDIGAKLLLEKNKSSLVKIQVSDECVLHDIDQLSDVLV